MNWLIGGLVVAGHGLLWLGVFNRLHGTALRPRALKAIELLIGVWFLLFCVLTGRQAGFAATDILPPRSPLTAYSDCCLVVFAIATIRWGWLRSRRPPSCLINSQTTRIDVAQSLGRKPAGNFLGRICTSLPGNEILTLEVTHKIVSLSQLPAELSGLRIAHWSDLHLTGRIGREFFEFVAQETERLAADMIVVTGDIHDTWNCRDWLVSTVGRLKAPEGVYFILGNHDLRPGRCAELRALLERLGLVDLGGKALKRSIRGTEILIAGNEMPWFGPPPELPDLPELALTQRADRFTNPLPFQILLSHSPDQVDWARRKGFDLVLAGHTHGGQICLPIVGPVVSPSRYGVRFAGGLFEVGSTVLHVSRGLSGEEPIRFGCPPELALIELRQT